MCTSGMTGNQMFKKLNDMMRINVVPTRELLSESYSRDGHDSAFESTQQMNSQMNSQNDFSQINSQDLFTQQYSSGSEMSTTGGGNRRPSMYDKWMNKGPMYNKGSNPPGEPKPPYSMKPNINTKQDLHLNKSKAKDRDERDILQQVANVVQECTKEIKSSVTSLKDKLQCCNDQSADKIQETISSFVGELCEHQDRILNAVKEKENKMVKINQLEKQLAMKDATIAQLEKDLEDRQGNDNEDIIRAVKKEIKDPTSALDKKVSQVLDLISEGSELSNQQVSEHKHQTELQRKFNMEFRHKQQKNMKDTEYRILEELNAMKQDMKYREDIWQKQCLDQLHKAQENQFKNLQKQLVDLEDRSQKNKYKSNDGMKLQTDVIENIFKRQWKSMELFLENQFGRQVDMQERQLEKILDKFSENEERSLVEFQSKPDYQLTLPYFEEHFSKYHSDVKKQIEELHVKHREEIRRIQEELHEQRLAKDRESRMNVASEIQKTELYVNTLSGSKDTAINGNNLAFDKAKATMNPPLRLYQKQSGYSMLPTRRSPFSSYGPLNSRSLFSKSHPSPVAAVLPHRKESQLSSLMAPTQAMIPSLSKLTENIHDEGDTEEEVYEDFVEAENDKVEENIENQSSVPKKKKGKKRRKKKLSFSRNKVKKCINKQPFTDSSTNGRFNPDLDHKNVAVESASPKQRVLRSSTVKQDCNKETEGFSECKKLKINNNKTFSPSTVDTAICQSTKYADKPHSYSESQHISRNKCSNLKKLKNAASNMQNEMSREKIYDFEDDYNPPSFTFCQPQATFTCETHVQQYQQNKQKRGNPNSYSSPAPASMCSKESSPSMSVTEVVIKRKIKCDNKKTPDLRNFHHAQNYNYDQCSEVSKRDMLATIPTVDPIFSQADYQTTIHSDENEEQTLYSSDNSRNLCEKVKDSNFVEEITESIRRRTQRRYWYESAQ